MTIWDTQTTGKPTREQPYPMEAEEAAATHSTSTSRPVRSGTGAPLAPHLSMARTNQTASSAATASPASSERPPVGKSCCPRQWAGRS